MSKVILDKPNGSHVLGVVGQVACSLARKHALHVLPLTPALLRRETSQSCFQTFI